MSYRDLSVQREYQRNWVAKRRAAWLAENGPCVECGLSFQCRRARIVKTFRFKRHKLMKIRRMAAGGNA